MKLRKTAPLVFLIVLITTMTAFGGGMPTVAIRDACRAREATRCGGAEPPLLGGFDILQVPSIPEPQARVPYRDEVFGRCVTRLTDRARDLAQGDRSQGLKNEYSRVQSFNADGSLILIRGTEATWYLYRADTLDPLGVLPLQGSVDPRWSASDPSILYYMDGTKLMLILVQTGETAPVHDFAADFPGQGVATVWTRYEGSPSLDGRTWGFMAQDAQGQTVAFLIYDQRDDAVIAKRDMRGVQGASDFDSVTISPQGSYFVAQFGYCAQGTMGTDAQPCGLMVYDRSLQHGRGLVRNTGHGDLALDSMGREVMVFQQLDRDFLSTIDLETGAESDLWPIDFSHTPMGFHFSGRGFQISGWALVSTHDADAQSHTWMDDQVFAMELKPGGRVVRLAHTHSVVDQSGGLDYFAEPQASANQDFTKLLFTTNWGRTGTDQVETYLIELEPGWDGACHLACSADVPSSSLPGEVVTFMASASATGCQGDVVYEWTFGDGSAPSGGQKVTHAYASAGTYTWTATVSIGAAASARSGIIQVGSSEPGPEIGSVAKMGSPFRIKIDGAHFKDSAVFIGGDATAWPMVQPKGESQLILGKGAVLKGRFPKGTAVALRVVNPDGQSASASYTR